MHAGIAAPGRGLVAHRSPLTRRARRAFTVVSAVLVTVCAAALVHGWQSGQPAVVLTAALTVAARAELLAAVLLRERDRRRRAARDADRQDPPAPGRGPVPRGRGGSSPARA